MVRPLPAGFYAQHPARPCGGRPLFEFGWQPPSPGLRFGVDGDDAVAGAGNFLATREIPSAARGFHRDDFEWMVSPRTTQPSAMRRHRVFAFSAASSAIAIAGGNFQCTGDRDGRHGLTRAAFSSVTAPSISASWIIVIKPRLDDQRARA